MDGLGELIIIQFVYIAILFLIIRAVIRQRKKAILYWFIAGLYMLTIAWLVTEYVNIPKTGNGGCVLAIGMYSMIVPGVLILIAALAFIVSQAKKKNG
jgi:apolipoprotein N-acyltransferase